MRLDGAEARRRFAGARVARLGTLAPDGAVHLVPICFVLLGESAYSAVDEKPKSSSALRRLTNIEARPRGTLLVDEYDDDWTALWWVRAEGDARIVTDGTERSRAVTGLRAKYPQYGTHRLDHAVLAIDVTTWSGWAASGVRETHGTAPDGTAAGGR